MSIHQDQKVLTAGKSIEEASRVVIMIHGRGATAESILELRDQLPEAAFLAPQAAKRTWYPKSFMEPREQNQPELDSALDRIGSVVEEAEKDVGGESVVLLGFSQGACLVTEYAARTPERYGGLIVLSGGLIGEELEDYTGDLEDTPVFIGCADSDPHIPVERVHETEEVFRDLNADVEKHVFEGSHHGITEYEVEKAREIIGEV